jgi:outer membrane receptor for ferrienterochelin and colicins
MLEWKTYWTGHQQGNPFIIARANDPFDKMFNMIRRKCTMTPDNPYALTLTLDMFSDLTKEFEAFGLRYTLK